MVIASKAVMIVLSCLAVAAGGTAIVYYGTNIGRAPVETKREAKAEAGSMARPEAKADVKPVARSEAPGSRQAMPRTARGTWEAIGPLHSRIPTRPPAIRRPRARACWKRRVEQTR